MAARLLLLVSMLFVLCHLARSEVDEVEVAVRADGSVEDKRFMSADVSVSAEQQVQHGANPEAPAAQSDRQKSVESVVTTLQHELATVQHMVKLQERKLQVLEKMRTVWVDELNQAAPRDKNVDVRTKVDVADAIERQLELAISSFTADIAPTFDTFFVEQASIPLREPIAGVQMTKLRASISQELIVVAYKSGSIAFYLSPTTEMLQLTTQHQDIKSIALNVQDDHLCLVVSYEVPMITIYMLKVVEKNSRKAESGRTKMPRFSPPGYILVLEEHRNVQLSAKASAITIARASRQFIAAVAQTDGRIEFFALNGTSLRQLQTNSSIAALDTRRNLLAFSNGTDVVLSSMTRAQGTEFHVCPGSSAKVSSIGFDAAQHDVMYAGTERGEVLVYSLNLGGSADTQPCQLLSRSAVSKRAGDHSPVTVATTKAFVIAAGPQDIAVFNVSRSPRAGVTLAPFCSTSLDKPTDSVAADRPYMTFSEGVMGSHLAFVAAGNEGKSELVLFHSLLPTEREALASQWTVFLYVGIVIAVAVGMQLYARRQRQTNVNPWDSIGKTPDRPYNKYDNLNARGRQNVSDSHDGEDEVDNYEYLSDDLRRQIAQAKRGPAHYPIDDPEF
ncbi:hypothetical protein PHYBOEH_008036 [Phytophthora boehmeriae]|uniref:Membrane-associated protein n=1 Tax=Phytophthora boehmeriae TaxID=109152 RepID=A0A8T1W2X6_9STRA|nr:hypothetical protein PHYBOEH_008036 [Phytophthora boehmeriae]